MIFIAGLFAAAYNSVASPDKGVNRFECTGIYPLNQTVFNKTFDIEITAVAESDPLKGVESSQIA